MSVRVSDQQIPTNEKPAWGIFTNKRVGTYDGHKSDPDAAQSQKKTPQFLYIIAVMLMSPDSRLSVGFINSKGI